MTSPRMFQTEQRKGLVCSGICRPLAWLCHRKGSQRQWEMLLEVEPGPILEDLVCSALRYECFLEFKLVPLKHFTYGSDGLGLSF